MPTPGSHRPCGCHRRFRASDPAGLRAISIYASVPRLSNIRFDSPQLGSRHGYPTRRGGLSDVFPPAAGRNHARGWDADGESTCANLETSRPATTDRRLSVGRSVSGVVNADLVLSTAETWYRRSRLASCSYIGTIDPPAPGTLARIRKSKSECLSLHQSNHVPNI